MSRLRHILVAVLLISAATRSAAEPADTFVNPLDVLIADPFVLCPGDRYYLYGTTRVHEGIEVWSSNDLVRWHNRGFAFRKADSAWSRGMFWAPEAFEMDGKFYLHFSAIGRKQSHRIVLASSDSPLGPFREVAAPWFESERAVIDSHVFTDTDGSRYLYYVLDCSENDHSEIRVARLDASLRLDGESKFCVKPSQPWEGGKWNEGPFVLKHDGTYYLMYSANGATDPAYSIGYATADSPMGPWTKFEGNPVLKRNESVWGTGHHSIIESPDRSELLIFYHTHQCEDAGWARQLAIDRIRFINEGDGPARMHVDGPTTRPQPMPSGAPKLVRGEDEEFDGPELDRRRWTIFNEQRDKMSVRDGRLIIHTSDGDICQRRADLKNLLLQPAPQGDFVVTTSVQFEPQQDFEQAFICLWQDHNNFARFSIVHAKDARIEVLIETNGRPTVRSVPNVLGTSVQLRITRTGERCTFLASADGEQWTIVAKDLDLLLHELKIGLGAASPASGVRRTAEFDYIRFGP